MTIFHNNVSEIKDHTVRKQVKEALKASDNIRGFCNQLEVRKVSYNIVDKIGFVVRIDGFAASEEEQGETDFSPMPVNHTLEFLKIQNHKIWS